MPRCFVSIFLWGLLMIGGWRCSGDRPALPDALRIRLAGEPDGLHPLLARSTYSWQLIDLLFQPLLQFDPESLDLVPVLAVASPEVRPWNDAATTGLAYTFEIREAARWDDGTAILASDYVFTLKCIFNPLISNIFRSYLDFIRAVEVDPDNPRRFTVFCAGDYFLARVATANFEVYPASAYDPEGLLAAIPLADFLSEATAAALGDRPEVQRFAEQFVAPERRREAAVIRGSGPYRLVGGEAGERVRLTKKSNWWGDALRLPQLAAYPEHLHYRIVPEVRTAIAQLKGEELDVLSNIPGRLYGEYREATGWAEGYDWYEVPQLSYYYIALNRKKTKLEERSVRRALALVLNPTELIEQVMYGSAVPTIGPFPPSSAYYHPDLKPLDYAPERARRLLAEAGWEDRDADGIVEKDIDGRREELRLTLDISTGSTTGEAVGLRFREAARQIGIAIDLRRTGFAALAERLRNGTFEMSYLARFNRPGEVDPQQDWYADRQRGGRSNYSGFGDAASDALIDSLRHCPDPERRRRYYHRLQALIYDDQPVLFVAVPQNCIAVHRRFRPLISRRSPNYFPARFVPQNQDQPTLTK